MDTNPCEHSFENGGNDFYCSKCGLAYSKHLSPIQQERLPNHYKCSKCWYQSESVTEVTEHHKVHGERLDKGRQTGVRLPEIIAKASKLLDEARVPTEDRHFLNLETGKVDDPTGLDFGEQTGVKEKPCDCICHSQVELCSNCANLQSPCVEPNQELEQLKEQLASIEHERWASWQKYLHSKLVESSLNGGDGSHVAFPTELYRHWERQINTPYEDLTPDEKASDRAEVNRYWPLIEKLIAHEKQEAVRQALDTLDRLMNHRLEALSGIPKNQDMIWEVNNVKQIISNLAELERTEGEN